jgi:hypothetical protein
VDSASPTAAARSQLHSSPTPLLKSSDTSFTLTGSANALRRKAISNAASSSTGPAATGEQHTGADMSSTGNVFGMGSFCHRVLTYIEEVASSVTPRSST